MKKKAFYSAEADIPDEDKHLYKKANGRWELKVDDFEGIDDLVAPGLKTTNADLKQEKTDAIEKARLAEVAQKAAESELAKVKKPGTKIVSDEEVAELEKYRALGPVADIERDLNIKTELEEKVAISEAENAVEKLAGDLKMNAEAVKDFIFRTDYGKGIKLGSKKVTVKGDKGQESEALVATVTIDQPDEKNPNKVVSTTKLLSEYLEEKSVPKYLSEALFTTPDTSNGKERTLQETRAPRVPDSSTRSANGDGDNAKDKNTSIAERLNFRRSTRTLPWSQSKNKE